MKPFDLERAKAGDPIGFSSSNAFEVEYLCDDMGGEASILVRYRGKGSDYWSPVRSAPESLVMLPKKRTVYTVVCRVRAGHKCIIAAPFDTATEAKEWAKKWRSEIDIYHEALPIEIEE